MNEMELLQGNLVVGGLLVAIGLIGFLIRRNMIVMFLCVEMVLQGVSLSFVAWSRYHGDWDGQIMVIFMIAVAACEAAIAMALVVMLFHQRGSLDITIWQDMREDDQPPFVDQEIPEDLDRDPVWPTLTPAGVEPDADPDALESRPRV